VVIVLNAKIEGLEEIQKAISKAPEIMLEELGKAYAENYEDWRGRMALRFRGGVPLGGAFGPVLGLRQRTGALQGSLGRRIDPLKASMAIFSTSPYAAARERGQVVVPRKGKYITIPLRDNLTAAGVPRFPSAAALIGKGTFIITTKKGNKLIVRKKPNGELEFLWLLAKRAVQPGPETDGSPSRFGFFDEWEAGEVDRQDSYRRALVRALDRVARKGA